VIKDKHTLRQKSRNVSARKTRHDMTNYNGIGER
jgi:hypothetical protein